MLKKAMSLLIASLMVISMVGCRSGEAPVEEPGGDTPEETSGEAEDYKIGIITGTVSQGEEEYQAAQNMLKKYGDKIVTATYLDNFSSESETTIANVVSLASDPAVKAIVFVQVVPVANKIIPEGNLSDVIRIIISNGIILYALSKTKGGAK